MRIETIVSRACVFIAVLALAAPCGADTLASWNDGTLWAEHPLPFQFVFALERIKTLAALHPQWKTQQPFKGVLEGDNRAVVASGERGILELLSASHAGMTTDEAQQLDRRGHEEGLAQRVPHEALNCRSRI